MAFLKNGCGSNAAGEGEAEVEGKEEGRHGQYKRCGKVSERCQNEVERFGVMTSQHLLVDDGRR